MTAHRGRTVSHAEFARMWADTTLSAAEIGRRLGGISGDAVLARARCRGLVEPRPYDQPKAVADEELFATLWAAGVSNSELARHFGCCEATVTNTRKRLRLRCRPAALRKPVDADDFEAMWQANVSVRGMARHFGLAAVNIRKRAKRLGLPIRPADQDSPISVEEYITWRLSAAMAREAAVTGAAMLDAEMVDGLNGRRAA